MTNLQKLLDSLEDFNWFGIDKGKIGTRLIRDDFKIGVRPKYKNSNYYELFSIPDLILDPRSNFCECVAKIKEDAGETYEEPMLEISLICDWKETKGDPEKWAGKVLEWVKK